MILSDLTKDELDRLAGAYYTALHCNDASATWETLPDWQRAKHRRGALALVAELRQMTSKRQSRTVPVHEIKEARLTG